MPGERHRLATRLALTVLIVVGPPCCLILLRAALLGGPAPMGVHTLVLPITAWVWVALFIVPAALLFPRQPPQEGPESGEDGGGGGGPRPDPGPVPPAGGIPLPDATQARARSRDHRPALYRPGTRREHPPAPRRIRTGPVRRRTRTHGASAPADP